MSSVVKCKKCRKPIIMKGHIVLDKKDLPYVLCPFCEVINYLPFESGENGNPELRSWVEDNKRK